MNSFEEAINQGETDQFFSGTGKYFTRSMDWDEHDITATQEDLRAYAVVYGEIQLYEKLNTELEKLLMNNIVPTDVLLNILSIIWWQNLNLMEEKKLKDIWTVSPMIKKEIARHINHPDIEPEGKKQIMDLLDRMKQRFGFMLMD